MITRIEKDYGDNYSQLFANATKALQLKYPEDEVYGADNFQIKTLEEYFVHLNQLITLNEELIKLDDDSEHQIYQGRTYSVLPLQEPIFNINANSRIITIPNDLKNVGVAGDHGAEILYFSIDRYFDNQDLAAEDMNTVIEWSNPNSTGEKTGITRAYIAETNIPSYLDSSTNDLKGHKILIGWVLGGDTMSAAGTIEFTIRFFQVDNESQAIKYSFSTQPAKITISKTLQYDIFDEIDDSVNTLVSNRIQTMESSGTSGLLNPPVFFININAYSGNVTDYENNILEEKYYCDLDGEELVVDVAAKTIDAREPTYTWLYKGINDDTYSPYDSTLYGDKYVEVGESTNTEGLILYEKIGENYKPAGDLGSDNLFYKVSSCRILKSGYYKARASIRTTSASTSAYSYVLIVPDPAVPIIRNNTLNSVVDETGYISMLLKEEPIAEGAEEMIYVARPSVELVKDSKYDDSNITSYSWSLNKNKNMSTIPEADFVNQIAMVDSLEEVTEEGWYKVIASNTRNNSNVTPMSNEINFRITKAPMVPVIDVDVAGSLPSGSHAEFKINHTINPADKYQVVWYQGEANEIGTIIPESEKIYTINEIKEADGVIHCPITFTAGDQSYAEIKTIFNNFISEATKTGTTTYSKA